MQITNYASQTFANQEV